MKKEKKTENVLTRSLRAATPRNGALLVEGFSPRFCALFSSMHGRIPHRLPAAHLLGDGEADEAAERAAGGGGSIDEADELRSDFASPDSEGSGGASSSSSAHEKDSTAAGEAEAEAGSGERNLTEHTGEGGSAATEATAGAEEKEEQATTTAAAAAAGNAAPTSSTSTSKPAPRPSWPPPRRPKKTYSQLQLPSPEQMAQEEAMNNCGVRTALSGVMGAGLGVVFGIFMGTMDMAGVGFCFFAVLSLSLSSLSLSLSLSSLSLSLSLSLFASVLLLFPLGVGEWG